MNWFKKDITINPADDQPVVHNHAAQSYVGEILVAGICLLLLPVVGWHLGLFLLETAGVYNPESFLAGALLWVAIIIPILVGLHLGFRHYFDGWLAHRVRIEQERTKQWQYRQRLQGSIVADSRRVGEDRRFAELILAVMLDAYQQLDEHGGFRGNSRPWAWRQAAQQVLYSGSGGKAQPAGEKLGRQVRPFLEREGVIAHDDVDLSRFPDFGSIQRLVGLVPVVGNPNRPLLGEGGGDWSIIE